MKVKSIRCPKCSSSMTYIRVASGELVCRTCGWITPNGLYQKPKEIDEETGTKYISKTG